VTTYTSSDQIGAALGITLTPGQAQQADALAQAITLWIDGYTGRSWQGVSPVAGELSRLVVPHPGDTLSAYPFGWYGGLARCYLAHAPVAAVTSVGLRTAWPNAPVMPLDPSRYELVDPEHGVLTVPGYGYGYLSGWYGVEALAVVDYSYADAVPADITLAATMIGSGAMAKLLAVQNATGAVEAHPELAGLSQIAVGQNDVNVQLADPSGSLASSVSAAGSGWAQPGSAVAAILDGYRRIVLA
jgi:hypothetical protein